MKPVIFLLILGIISCKTTTDVLDIYYNSEDDLTDKCTLDIVMIIVIDYL